MQSHENGKVTTTEDELQVSEDNEAIPMVNSPLHRASPNIETQSDVELASPNPFKSMADIVRESQRRFTVLSPQLMQKKEEL